MEHKRAISQSQIKTLSQQVGEGMLNKINLLKQFHATEANETPYIESSKTAIKQHPSCFDKLIMERRNMGVARNLSFIKV